MAKIYLAKLANLKKSPQLINKILSPPLFFQYYHQIKSSPNCDSFKTAKNIIAANISHFTVSSRSKCTTPRFLAIQCTVKRLIIGDYLFDEIGEFFKFAKISCHQIETLQSLDITSVGNRQINSLPNCHIWKTAKYNSRQIFSFYSRWHNITVTIRI